MPTPLSARYDIDFAMFRANQTGGDTWVKLTTDRFVEGLDQHFDRLLREYVSMICTVQQVMLGIESGELDTKAAIAERIRAHFPFAPVPDEVVDTRHEIEDGPVYADEQFSGWRDLDREALLDLCREHYDTLLMEHEHLSGTLAATHNRIGDIEGWGFWEPRHVRDHLYGQMIWHWPNSRPQNDETPAD